MKHTIPTRRMREHPNLEQLKRQAKQLLRSYLAGDPKAAAEVNAHYRNAGASEFALHDAQLVLARSYGFESWPKLKAYVDGVTVQQLSEAVRNNDLPRVQAMLRSRPEIADLAMSYVNEHRPLHYAVMGRLPEMTRLLMRHGAGARRGIHPHRAATTAWRIAKDRGYHEIVAIIEEEEQRRSPNDSAPEVRQQSEVIGDEAARAAVAAGDLDWIRAKAAEGSFVNPVRWDDGGLLTVAVQNNRPEILNFLLDLGWDPNEKVSSGEGDWVAYSQGFPLWYCAAHDRQEMAEMLLRRGADPNVHVDSSGSPVYSAYSHKQWKMAELLRRHGGLVSADIAAIYRQTELARQMIEDETRGVLPPGIVSPGKSLAEDLLCFGSSGGDPEIVRMALERIDWPRDDPRWFKALTEPLYFWHQIPWLYAGNRDFDRGTYLTAFRLILQRCDPNLPGSFGRTALHEVAAMGEWIAEHEAVSFALALLEAGAKTDVRDEILKSTPLGWACRWGRAGVVEALLEHGADAAELEAEDWARPLAWAEKMGHTDIAKLLRGRGR